MPSPSPAADVTAYTTLEALVLFQCLEAYGTADSVFDKVAEAIVHHESIRADKTFDPARLSPAGLKAIFKACIREQALLESGPGSQDLPIPRDNAPDNRDRSSREAGPSTPSRKRKAPSPPSLTPDAERQAQLIPTTHAKIYGQFRDKSIREIREVEARYRLLQRDIAEIEAGQWDEKIQAQIDEGFWDTIIKSQDVLNGKNLEIADRSATPGLPGQEQRPRHAKPEDTPLSTAQASTKLARTHSPLPNTNISSAQLPHALVDSKSGPASLHRGSPLISQAGPAPVGQPSLGAYGPSHPSAQPLPYNQGQLQAVVAGQSTTSVSTPIQASQQGSADVHSVAHQSQSGSSPARDSRPGAHGLSTPHTNSPSHPLATPYVLGQHTAPPAVQSQQGRVPQYPHHGAMPPNAPPVRPPHAGGYMLPPFQVLPQDPTTAQRQHQSQPSTPQPRPPPVAGTHTRTPVSLTIADMPTAQPPLGDIVKKLATYTPEGTPRPLPLSTSPSSSFKPQHTDGQMSPSVEPTTPLDAHAPSVSPISERAPSPEFARPAAALPRTRNRKESARHEAVATVETPSLSTRASSRGKTRGASVASSSVVASSAHGRTTRSQSIVSHADGEEAGSTLGDSRRRIKHEEPGTPSTTGVDESAAGTGAVRRGRSSRETQTPATVVSGKRKRGPDSIGRASSVADDLSTVLSPSAAATLKRAAGAHYGFPTSSALTSALFTTLHEPKSPFVYATRNFPRISNAIMDEITSHRLASIFSHPVKERDAPGYHSIVRRPQDLKSIRSAISGGAKVVNAAVNAAAHDQSSAPATPTNATFADNAAAAAAATNSPGNSSSTVQLPHSAESVPPRSIVNPAQLHREVARMFANAVMFNTGDGDGDANDDDANEGAEEGGVLHDARDMWEDVSKSVENWKRVSGVMVSRAPPSGGTGLLAAFAPSVAASDAMGTPSASASASAHPPAASDDDGGGGDTGETGTIGSRSKRRRL